MVTCTFIRDCKNLWFVYKPYIKTQQTVSMLISRTSVGINDLRTPMFWFTEIGGIEIYYKIMEIPLQVL